MRRLGVALAVGLVALLAACGIPTDGSPRPLAEDTPTSAVSPEPSAGDTTARVYLVTNDELLVPRDRTLEGDETPTTVLRTLLLPTNEEEQEAGLQTSIPPLTTVLEVSDEDGILAVDLSEEWGNLELPAALPAYAQVVLTLTDLPGVEGVRFLVEGVTVDAAPTVNQQSSEVVEASDYAILVAE